MHSVYSFETPSSTEWATPEQGAPFRPNHFVDIVEPPKVELDGPFQMQISALDYNSYVGGIGLGRIKRGSVRPGQQISVAA